MALVNQKWWIYKSNGEVFAFREGDFLVAMNSFASQYVAFGIGKNDVDEFKGWQLMTGKDHLFLLVPVSRIMPRDEIKVIMQLASIKYLVLPYDVRDHINVV